MSTATGTSPLVWTAAIEYPGELLLSGPTEGTLYDYINHAYLDGLVNLTAHEEAYLVRRYEDAGHEEIATEINASFHTKLCRFDRDCSDCVIGWVTYSENAKAAMLAWVDALENKGRVKLTEPSGWVGW